MVVTMMLMERAMAARATSTTGQGPGECSARSVLSNLHNRLRGGGHLNTHFNEEESEKPSNRVKTSRLGSQYEPGQSNSTISHSYPVLDGLSYRKFWKRGVPITQNFR